MNNATELVPPSAALVQLSWLMLLLGTLSFKQRTAWESLSANLEYLHFQRLTFAILALLFVLPYISKVRMPRSGPLRLFLIYMIIAFVSTLWSVSPLVTLGKSFEICVAALVILVCLNSTQSVVYLRKLFHLTLCFQFLLLAYALIGYLVSPADFSATSRGILPFRLTSPILSAVGISFSGTILSLFFLAKATSGNTKKYLLFYLALYFFFLIFPVLSQGRVGAFLCILGTLVILSRRKPVVLAFVAAFGLFALYGDFGNTIVNFFYRGQSVEDMITLTGRTILWELGWDSFLSHPFFGVGFGVGSRNIFLGSTETFPETVSSIHNGFLEVLLGLGIAGFGFWLASLISGLKQACIAFLKEGEIEFTIVFFMVVSVSALSSGVGGWMSIPVAFFLICTAYLTARQPQSKVNLLSSNQPSKNRQVL